MCGGVKERASESDKYLGVGREAARIIRIRFPGEIYPRETCSVRATPTLECIRILNAGATIAT
jgi:hypothetical protein